jgi:hypothetical protein
MRYTGIQPQYFPRLHYFARAISTDIFVVRDEVQFVARHKYPNGKIGLSYQCDTTIKQSNGAFILHVPIVHDGLQPINKTGIAYTEKWALKHLQTIKFAYIKSPYFTSIFPELEMILSRKYTSIADLSITTFAWGLLKLMGEVNVIEDYLTINYINEQLYNKKPFRLKKILLGKNIEAFKNKDIDRNVKIINAIKEVGATEDYCGETAFAAYMDRELFQKNGISITIQNWKCDEYPQLYTKQEGFIQNLSIIDLLMNLSTPEAVSILQGGN